MGVRSLGNAIASFGYKFGTTGLEAVNPAPIPVGLTAGGVISDYTASGTTYRAHIFTASGTFGLGNISSTVEYLVVAGGGGGGSSAGGGGGAGGFRTNVSGHPLGSSFPVSTSPDLYSYCWWWWFMVLTTIHRNQ